MRIALISPHVYNESILAVRSEREHPTDKDEVEEEKEEEKTNYTMNNKHKHILCISCEHIWDECESPEPATARAIGMGFRDF